MEVNAKFLFLTATDDKHELYREAFMTGRPILRKPILPDDIQGKIEEMVG